MGKFEKLKAKLERKEISPMSYYRQANELTLEDLAEAVKVTPATIHKWECKNVRFSKNFVRKIAKILKVEPEVLYDRSDDITTSV